MQYKIIYEIFSGGDAVSTQEIRETIVAWHKKQGGLPPKNVKNIVKSALRLLKNEGLTENVSFGYWKILQDGDVALSRAFAEALSETEADEEQSSELIFQRGDFEKLQKISKMLQDVLAKYE